MAKVTQIDFGSPGDRQRAKLADSLETIAEHIRRGKLEFAPRGFVLLLQSDLNPAQFEVLNVGMPTGLDMARAAIAIRSRIQKSV